MSSHLNIPRSASAVESSLVINHILEAGVRKAPDQTITYGDRTFTYRDLNERVHRLAGALAAQGVKPGDTVAVMDWDTNRYLEAFCHPDDGRGAAHRERAPEPGADSLHHQPCGR